MGKYVKPIVIMEGCSEGVYAASGDVLNLPECDSKYMKGQFQAAKYNGTTVKENYGCVGCRAYRSTGCALLVDQAYIDGATSYDSDRGYRRPTWEEKGFFPNDMMDDTRIY